MIQEEKLRQFHATTKAIGARFINTEAYDVRLSREEFMHLLTGSETLLETIVNLRGTVADSLKVLIAIAVKMREADVIVSYGGKLVANTDDEAVIQLVSVLNAHANN